MARPKTKGDPISIRLSQHHDQLLRLAAEQAGMPVTTLATEMLENVLSRSHQRIGGEWVPLEEAAKPGRVHDPTCRCAICKPNSGVYEKAAKKKVGR